MKMESSLDQRECGFKKMKCQGLQWVERLVIGSEPEIKEFELTENDKFMIVASDGIWEFIDSQECVEIVKDYYENNDMKGCSDYLYEISKERWLKEEEVIDDITLILVFFE